eukprot:c12781_g1_i1 orf=1-162(-)
MLVSSANIDLELTTSREMVSDAAYLVVQDRLSELRNLGSCLFDHTVFSLQERLP